MHQAGIADAVSRQVQFGEVAQARDPFQTCIGHQRVAHVEPRKVRHAFESQHPLVIE